MNVLEAKTIGLGKRLISTDYVFLVFEDWDLVHEDFEGLFAVAGMDDDAVKRISKSGIFGGDFKEFLVVHNHDNADPAGFEYGNEKVGDID